MSQAQLRIFSPADGTVTPVDSFPVVVPPRCELQRKLPQTTITFVCDSVPREVRGADQWVAVFRTYDREVRLTRMVVEGGV